jgi:hypothetical protein
LSLFSLVFFVFFLANGGAVPGALRGPVDGGVEQLFPALPIVADLNTQKFDTRGHFDFGCSSEAGL